MNQFKTPTPSTLILMALASVILTIGCSSRSNRHQGLTVQVASETQSVAQSPNFSIQLLDGNTVVYDEVTNTGSLQVQNGKSYTLKLISSTPNVAVNLVLDSGESRSLSVGDNALQLTGISNKIMKITSTVPKYGPRTKNYDIGVTCTDAEMAGFAVNPSAISVSSAGDNNLFNYSASGIASGGTGNYDCAWDFNGDGIRDSAFAPCSQAQTSIFSNHVNQRIVSVQVRDIACNKVLVASVAKDLGNYPSVVRLPQPQVYIHANVGSPAASTDKRLNLKHLSTNMTGIPSHAQCMYSRTAGRGTYTISGLNRYGVPASQSHGLVVSFQNLLDNVDIVHKTGTINSDSAQIKTVQFRTDQSPDSQTQLSFEGDSKICTGSIAAIPKNVTGNECAGGPAQGVEGSYTVSAEGSFSCTDLPSLNAFGQTVNVTEGSFFCEFTLVDQCIGKGGSSGGTPPIQL